MILFVVTQLIGLLIFSVVSFSLFIFLQYKRSLAISVHVSQSSMWQRLAAILVSLIFVSGMGLRIQFLSDAFNKPQAMAQTLLREEADNRN